MSWSRLAKRRPPREPRHRGATASLRPDYPKACDDWPRTLVVAERIVMVYRAKVWGAEEHRRTQLWSADCKTWAGLTLPLPELEGELEDSDCGLGAHGRRCGGERGQRRPRRGEGRRRAARQVHHDVRGRWLLPSRPAREDPHVHPLRLSRLHPEAGPPLRAGGGLVHRGVLGKASAWRVWSWGCARWPSVAARRA